MSLATSLCRVAGELAERPFDPGPDLAHHQLHRAHRRPMWSRTDLERKAHVHGVGRTDFADQLFDHGLDVADQEILWICSSGGSSGNGLSTSTVPCMTSCRRRKLEARRDW